MNGLSFEEFENASFDSLYGRGFAGAKSFDEASKGWQAQAAKTLQNEAAQQRSLRYSGTPQLPSSTTVPQVSRQHAHNALPTSGSFARTAAPHTDTTRALPSTATVPAQRMPVPMNDMGALPGNTRVDHTWRPSKEADSRAGHLALTGASAPVTAARPAAGGDKGTFMGWKSN
mmetsp:Transcript_49460/g.115659  ORF Transcript_49460/g.115659 Transcript_49460/m.115659 type:complete len:173 (+) Transcript_49460:100-618(+)|eukprot:5222920-Amphidinium_carterae.1